MHETLEMTSREKECLDRVARGQEIEQEIAVSLARQGLIWRTAWGKFALSQNGVAALNDLRASGNR